MTNDKNLPLVSIVIPAYNAGAFLRSSLVSCFEQTYKNTEIILVDDGSTDNTSELISEFINLKNFRYIKNDKNSGLIFTLNRGIELAQGQFIARMDADDISLPTRIAKQVEVLLTNPLIEVVGSDVILIDEHDHKHGKPRELIQGNAELEWSMVTSCPLHHPTVMFKKKFQYLAEERHIEDLGLWSRIILSGKKISVIKEPLLLYRKHSNSITSKYAHNQIEASATLAKRYAKEKWKVDIGANFLLSIRTRDNFSDNAVFIEAKKVISDLMKNGFPEAAEAARINIQTICITYMHFFFLRNEKNKLKAFINCLKFVFAPTNLRNTPIAFFNFYYGLSRKII
jgi:glycosyltransferase involved in cell wall biosynthesis